MITFLVTTFINFINDPTNYSITSLKLNLTTFIIYTFIFILSPPYALLSTTVQTHYFVKKDFFSIEKTALLLGIPTLSFLYYYTSNYVANNAFFCFVFNSIYQ